MKKTLSEILVALGSERRIHYALDRIEAALFSLDSPHKNVQTIVIAGTNGKGTVTLLTSQALKRAGKNVATFISPHLQNLNERFLYNMDPAPLDELDAIASRHFATAQKYALSHFEFLTLLFFVWAREKKVDVLVLEVGLGGRLDATNVTHPLACSVTSIDFDHMAYLGDTLEAILMEKLGVVPRGGTLVSGVTQEPLQNQIRAWAREREVNLIEAESLSHESGVADWEKQTFSLQGNPFSLASPNPKMIHNARTAFLLLRNAFPEIPVSMIQEAFQTSLFPGRFETVAQHPRVILSGDHNPAGLDSLFETLERLPPTALHILCGFSPDKPYREMFERLKHKAKRIALCPLANARNGYAEDYRDLTPHFFSTSSEALQWILSDCPSDEVCLVTGSLYLVGEIGAHFRPSVKFTH